MKRTNAVLKVMSITASYMTILSVICNKTIMYKVSGILMCILLLIRFIVFFIKQIFYKRYSKFNASNKTLDSVIIKEQNDNFIKLVNRIKLLSDIIEANGSYYNAQREYIEIKQLINELNVDELRDSQKAILMLILEEISKDMFKLELKR